DHMPRGKTTPLHQHPTFEEAIYVLEGEILVHSDGEEHTVGTGGVAPVPPGVPHALLLPPGHPRLPPTPPPRLGPPTHPARRPPPPRPPPPARRRRTIRAHRPPRTTTIRPRVKHSPQLPRDTNPRGTAGAPALRG